MDICRCLPLLGIYDPGEFPSWPEKNEITIYLKVVIAFIV